MQVQIKFKTTAWSSVHGSFGPGDVLRCGQEEARHFVEDAGAAEYLLPAAGAKPAAEAEPSATPVAATRRTRKAS